jgi:hypothetical protein
MAGECSTAYAPYRTLFADGDVVGLLCARCCTTFRHGDCVRAYAVMVAYDDQVAAHRATVLAHHDCRDPAADRVRH